MQNNTEHYDFSALIYLSEHGRDFEGGEFVFVDDGATVNTTVLPMSGRAVLFTAGQENLHRVMPVTSGVRYAISMWFTCDPDRHMSQFLDGSMHQEFRAGAQATDKSLRNRDIASRRAKQRIANEKSRRAEEL